jgi:multisubunit Na+/H+ antiporter MnhB subunit
MLYLVVALMLLTGLAHSYLGERYILVRLFKRDNLPQVLGSTRFTTGTLRFVWHLTTVVWWCLAYLVYLAADGSFTQGRALRAIGICALVSAVFPLFFTRGRHLSWLVFVAVGVLLFMAADGE